MSVPSRAVFSLRSSTRAPRFTAINPLQRRAVLELDDGTAHHRVDRDLPLLSRDCVLRPPLFGRGAVKRRWSEVDRRVCLILDQAARPGSAYNPG